MDTWTSQNPHHFLSAGCRPWENLNRFTLVLESVSQRTFRNTKGKVEEVGIFIPAILEGKKNKKHSCKRNLWETQFTPGVKCEHTNRSFEE